ncbi:Cytochrome C' [Modicisalibacter ilicicola DSM 19980]|uniref:Cytochrome C n=1 Tax=Modicisalibacter ilicicola DSM 19980 TaxID=1121942 RepID=A0A1M4SI04_9GAMM|nr:cytochrome c [Halomonas ilicicola]SHE31894.1 Cytochrome C' [Halomonas ilicicola DSM 19980]
MNKRHAYRAIGSAAMLASLTLSGAVFAAEPVGPKLTDKLRGLLVKEMVEIEAAMQATYSAIVQGKHDEVAQRGQAIHDSFILEQSLTEQDRQDLKAAVPKGFLQMDEHFHQLSASLAEAGERQDTQAQVETFNRMTESCVACHSRYVTDRFEGLEDPSIPEGWGHHDGVASEP